MTSPPWIAAPKNTSQPRPRTQHWITAAAAGALGVLISGCTADSGTGSATGAQTDAEPAAQEEAESQTEAQESEAPAESAASASGSAVVDIARRYVGTPYVHGGTSPAGFDCSGFTSYVFAQVGVSLPRSSGAQRNAGQVVSAAEARPGDLVWGPGHVGIYTGNGQHIAARNPGTALHEGPIWLSNPTFIRVG